jgi:DNA-binding PadR family transcriptional regulator
MIELLILYSLKTRERTLYSLRSDIIEKFGYFTKPSIGTIHPALKRLLKLSAVTIRNDFSQGGKKSTFYGLSMHAMKHFRDFFFSSLSENPSVFFTEMQSRIAVMSMLEDDLKETFVTDALIKLESFALDFKNALEDEYKSYDKYQSELLKKNIVDVESFKTFVAGLK